MNILLLFVALAVVVFLLPRIGAARWRSLGSALQAALAVAARPAPAVCYDPAALSSLPVPVQRYFRAALTPGQPLVAAVTLAHVGSFNMSESGAAWKPFTSQQRVVTQRPGFVWDARIAMLLGLPVRVHDAYVAGEGILRAALFGLIPLADQRGTPELAQGELMRFLAEAAWYPTALLPGQGVSWEAVDETSARATLADGETEVSLLFRFGEDGLIDSVCAEARGRMVRGAVVPTPWEGHWRDYVERDGMRVPSWGEVAWLLPQGPQPYWRGRVEDVRYDWRAGSDVA